MINTICYKKSQLYQEIWGISDEYYVDYPASNKKKTTAFLYSTYYAFKA